MPTSQKVVVELLAKVAGFDAKIKQSAAAFGGSMKRIEGSAINAERVVGRLGRSLTGLIGGFGGVLAGREIAQLVDSAKNIEAQLRLATRESGNFAQAQEDVRRIATTTRASLEATANLYASFQRNARELGITQEQAARATETVSKAFLISGSTAVEASQGIRQLVQGLQSGVLRGDEFNTIMEAAPRLADLFAKALGVTRGELRALSEDGKLTAATLTDALTNRQFTADIDEEFRQLPVTFGQAMENIKTAATIVFGAFDKGGQFSNAIIGFVQEGTTGFAGLENAAERFGRTASIEIAGLVAVMNSLIGAVQAVDAQFGGLISRLVKDAWVFQLANPLGAVMFGLRNNTIAAQGRTDQARALGQGSGNFAGRFLDQHGFTAPPLPVRPASSGGKAGGRKRSGPSSETLERRAEQERQRAIRDEAAKQSELARLQDDILAARRALATASEDILEFELAAIESDKVQRLADLETDRKLGKLNDDEVRERAGLVEETAHVRRQRAILAKQEADAVQDAAAARSEQSTLEAEAQLARTREERRDVEQRILDLAYKEEERALRRAAADGEIADLDAELLKLKRRQAAAQEGLNRDTASPFGQFIQGIRDTGAALDDELEGIATGALNNVIDGLGQVAAGFSSLGGVARGVLGQITSMLVKLAIQMAILKIFGLSTGGPVPGKAMGGRVGYAPGGLIVGPGTATSDSIPAFAPGGPIRVSNGEYIVRGSTVRKLGVHTLDQINTTGRLPSNASAARGGFGGGMSENDLRRLEAVLRDTAMTRTPVVVRPTMEPRSLAATIFSDPGSQREVFNFFAQNGAKIKSQLNR